MFNYDEVRKLLRYPRLTVARYGEVPTDPTGRARDAHVRNLLSMWMLNMDGKTHGIARKDLMPMFSNRALSDYATLVQEQVDRCIATLGQDGCRIEAYGDIAFPLPAQIVLSIMGLEDLMPPIWRRCGVFRMSSLPMWAARGVHLAASGRHSRC